MLGAGDGSRSRRRSGSRHGTPLGRGSGLECRITWNRCTGTARVEQRRSSGYPPSGRGRPSSRSWSDERGARVDPERRRDRARRSRTGSSAGRGCTTHEHGRRRVPGGPRFDQQMDLRRCRRRGSGGCRSAAAPGARAGRRSPGATELGAGCAGSSRSQWRTRTSPSRGTPRCPGRAGCVDEQLERGPVDPVVREPGCRRGRGGRRRPARPPCWRLSGEDVGGVRPDVRPEVVGPRAVGELLEVLVELPLGPRQVK